MCEIVDFKTYKKALPLTYKLNKFYEKYFEKPYGRTNWRTVFILPIFSLVVMLATVKLIWAFETVVNPDIGLFACTLYICVWATINIIAWYHLYKYFRCCIMDYWADNYIIFSWRTLAISIIIVALIYAFNMTYTVRSVIICSIFLVSVFAFDLYICVGIKETFYQRSQVNKRHRTYN